VRRKPYGGGAAVPARAAYYASGDRLDAPETPPEGGAAAAVPPSLVTPPHKSTETPPSNCPNARWLVGDCEHGQQYWTLIPCKRRDCVECGIRGRRKIARRIAYGVRKLWPCAWMVLTFKKGEIDDHSTADSRKRLSAFIRWLRVKRPGLAYAATYERTMAGTLHINLLVGSWVAVPQVDIERAWGRRVWIAWVRDEGAVSAEAAKTYSPESLGNYVSKLDQAVQQGRRVSFSRHWPVEPAEKLRAKIRWRLPDALEQNTFNNLWRLGWVQALAPDLWRRLDGQWTACVCSEVVVGSTPGPP